MRIQNLGNPLRWAFRENSQQKTVNWKPFTIFAKDWILDVWVDFEYTSKFVMKKFWFCGPFLWTPETSNWQVFHRFQIQRVSFKFSEIKTTVDLRLKIFSRNENPLPSKRCHQKYCLAWSTLQVFLVILSANEGATWKPVCIFENGS